MTSSFYKTSNSKTFNLKKRNVPKGMIKFFLLLISKIKSLLPLNLPRMNKGVNKKINEINNYSIYFILERLFVIFLKNMPISFLIVMAVATPIYFIAPSLFEWETIKLVLTDVLPLEIFENEESGLDKVEREIIELRMRIIRENLEKEILEDYIKEMTTEDLEKELKAISSKEGPIEIKYESVNWWTVILTISGITIIGGVSVYLLLNG